MKDEGLNDEGFQLFRGFADIQFNRWKDICDCRVAFATENANNATFKLFLTTLITSALYHMKSSQNLLKYVN